MRKEKERVKKKKWTEHEWAVEIAQAFWYTWNTSPHGRGGVEKIFEEIMTQNIPNLRKI